MNNKMFNVVVIGSNHFNTLGVIRSLGENNIKPYVIIIGNKNSFVKKSRYIEKYWIVDENEENIMDILKNKINENNTYIIPTSDYSALIIDKNMEKLQEKYVLPNINKKPNSIVKLMDKYNQYKLARENNIKVAESKLINIESNKIINEIYPCILKPVVSANGKKADIRICKNQEEFASSIEELQSKNYKEILIQEIIDYDYELDIPGYTDGNIVRMPGVIKKVNIYPAKKGSTCYGIVKDIKINDIDKLENIFKKIKFNGIFDIEIFMKGDIYYLNEINFRNSAISYALTKEKIHIILDWILINEGYNLENKKIKKKYAYIVENYNFKLVKDKEIKLSTFIKEFLKARKFTLINVKDPKPLLYKLIYSLKKEEK